MSRMCISISKLLVLNGIVGQYMLHAMPYLTDQREKDSEMNVSGVWSYLPDQTRCWLTILGMRRLSSVFVKL